MMPVALGTQTAGSVLRPALFCGVVGFKPTYGRVSRHGILPLAWTLDHAGLFARSVEDIALVLLAIAGADGRDETALDMAVTNYPRDIEAPWAPLPPRLGIPGDVYPNRLTAPARDRLRDVAQTLKDAGAGLKNLELPPAFDTALDAQHIIMSSEVSAVHLSGVRQRADEYGPRLRLITEAGALVPAPLYLRAQQVRRVIRDAVLPLFERVDCLLVPAAAGAAPEGLESTGDASFNAPWSLLGLPAISLPAGQDEQGLPLGVQLVAAPWHEASLLAAAAWCERVIGAAVVAAD